MQISFLGGAQGEVGRERAGRGRVNSMLNKLCEKMLEVLHLLEVAV